jgi:uncharacterized membrane protein HdeD (DUF308 family)
MNLTRGILLIAAGSFLIYRGWMVHTHQAPWLFYSVGVLAIVLGVWRLMRKPPKPLA